MAKRTRFQNRTTAKQTARRTQRAAGEQSRGIVPAPRPTAADAPIPVDLPDDEPMRATSSALTSDEVRRAEELEAEATRKEKAEIAESLRRRNRAEEAADRAAYAGDVNAPLSVRASHEYAYVARDVKRIAVTGGLMIGILALLHILVNVLGVISI
jgi:hypothetical protein